ncbi:MAG: DNA gyrase inhibitor YacG [Zoogloea sp.]|nr:DNA gyrase inhibitor YacG [Zoogloea sp.]
MNSKDHVRIVKCPACGADVEWRPESRFRPFCSERCRQLDLGAWASGSYRIPAAEAESGQDESTPDSET